MPRVERLARRNPFLEQSVQKIVLRFYREVMNVAPDFIHRRFVFLKSGALAPRMLLEKGVDARLWAGQLEPAADP
jgi:hypothetical protein